MPRPPPWPPPCCTTWAGCWSTSSPPTEVSIRSLAVQGGPMNADEVEAFRELPAWEAAVALRRWDDEAKVPGKVTREVADYRSTLEGVLAS